MSPMGTNTHLIAAPIGAQEWVLPPIAVPSPGDEPSPVRATRPRPSKRSLPRAVLEEVALACALITPLLWALAAGVVAGTALRSAVVSGLVAGAWLIGVLFWRDWRWRWF